MFKKTIFQNTVNKHRTQNTGHRTQTQNTEHKHMLKTVLNEKVRKVSEIIVEMCQD